MMTEQSSNGLLPSDVIAALQQGSKIDAIKRLRQARDLQLKDAKDEVDRYIRNNPALARKYEQQDSGARRVLWLLTVGAILAALAWMFFSANG
jgi:hypothetical protein